MRREFHVRFCEGAGGQFPRATRLVLGFQKEEDARRVMEVLPKRFGKYGLTLHPTKTRLLWFGRPSGPGEGRGEPGSFDLLGFTHYWGPSRRGKLVVQRKTAKGRLGRTLKRVGAFCRRVLHEPIKKQWEGLKAKMQGHYQYYGITGNTVGLKRYRNEVARIWKYWLSRRGGKAGAAWDRMNRWLEWFPLPPIRVVHSIYRLAAKL